jgi:hypothetical protein
MLTDMTRSRNRRLRLIPSHLPLIRDKLAEYERVALKEEMAAHSQYERSMEAAWNFADNLAVAQLWWISRDMTALAEDTVRAGDFPKSEAPAQSGLIFFDGDVQMVRFPVTDDATGRKVGDAHVSALFWQCDGNGDIELMGFTDHPCALKECDAKSFSLPVIRFANGIFNEHVGVFRWFGDLLRAVWALSAEPHICEAKPAKPDMAHPLPQRFDLNDPETISGWTERIEAHNAYIDVMEPNNAVLRNPLDVDSTFHIRIYDYFIDFHEDREIVDDLEFTPSDVEADDWTEDIKRCLEENGWRLDSKIGTDSDDSDLLVFDCVKA